MATINANVAAPNQPRIETVGAVERYQSFVSSVSLSVGDVIKFNNLKLPLGAQVLDVRFAGNIPATSAVFAFGTDYASEGAVFGSATLTTARAFFVKTDSIPYNVSVSDDFQPRYVTMTATLQAQSSATVSASMTLLVRYTMDP